MPNRNGKRLNHDLSITVPNRNVIKDNGPLTAVPKGRRPPSGGMKSANATMVTTPQRNPIFTPPMPMPMSAVLPPSILASHAVTEEKKGLFGKLFKKKPSAVKGHAIV